MAKKAKANAGQKNNQGESRVPKDLGTLDPKNLKRRISQAAYIRGQIAVEKALLREAGVTPEESRKIVASWRGGLERWFKELDHLAKYHPPLVAAWGSASDTLLTRPGAELVSETIYWIAHLLVGGRSTVTNRPRACGVVHGSSITGMMGLWDRTWAEARKAFSLPEVPIVNVPLNWVVREIREPPAKSGKRKHRCPPQLLLSERTEMFGYPEPILFLVAPGGLGTAFELFWALLSAQMRGMLLTAFTGWKWIPEIIMLDTPFEPEKFATYLEGKAGVGRLRKGWFFDGLRELLVAMVAFAAVKQADVSRVTLLRVGDGEDVDDNRVGPKVIYRPTPHKAAVYVSERLDFAVARGRRPAAASPGE